MVGQNITDIFLDTSRILWDRRINDFRLRVFVLITTAASMATSTLAPFFSNVHSLFKHFLHIQETLKRLILVGKVSGHVTSAMHVTDDQCRVKSCDLYLAYYTVGWFVFPLVNSSMAPHSMLCM